jgi:hypothetical protein
MRYAMLQKYPAPPLAYEVCSKSKGTDSAGWELREDVSKGMVDSGKVKDSRSSNESIIEGKIVCEHRNGWR